MNQVLSFEPAEPTQPRCRVPTPARFGTADRWRYGLCLLLMSLLVTSTGRAEEPSQSSAKEETSRPAADEGTAGRSLAEATKLVEQRRPASTSKSSKEMTPLERAQAEKEYRLREAARKRGDYTFDDLKFDIEKDQAFEESMLTDAIRELNKKKIKIRGYILPTSVFQTKGIKQFVLVRDNQECCFGPGAAIYDCIMVEMEPGKTTEFKLPPIAVTGTFVIDTESYQYPDGGHYAIFKIVASEAK